MKGVLGIFCVCLLAGQGFAFQPLAYQPSKTYVYDGQSRYSAVIPNLNDQQISAFAIDFQLYMYALSAQKMTFQLKEIRTAKVNDAMPSSYDDDVELHHSPAPEYERQLSKPIEVTYENGVIQEIRAEKSDPGWSVNMKKAIITPFQLDLLKSGRPVTPRQGNQEGKIDPEASLYSVYEDGIMGECQTNYHIQSIQSLDHPNMSDDVHNVTKVKNYRNCVSSAKYGYHNFESQGCASSCSESQPSSPPVSYVPGYPPTWDFGGSDYVSGCPYGFQPDYHPVKAFSITKYNVSNASSKPVIEDIKQESRIHYETNGNFIHLYTVQSYNLTHVKQSQGQPKLQEPVKYESLEYELPDEDDDDDEDDEDDLPFMSIYGPIDESEMIETVKRKLESIAQSIVSDDPSTSENLGLEILELTNAANVLGKKHLKQIYQSLESQSLQKKPRDLTRKLWLDVLGLSPGNAAAKVAIELIKSNRVSNYEASSLLEGIGKNLNKPQLSVIDQLIAYLESPSVQRQPRQFTSLAIAIGKLIDQACVDPELTNTWESDDDEDDQPQTLKTHQKQPNESEPRRPSSGDSQWRSQQSSSDSQPRGRFARDINQSGPKPQQKKCTPQKLREYIQLFATKLEQAKKPARKAIFIEVLAHMSTPLVLPYLEPYVTGEAPSLKPLEDDDAEFVSTVCIYSLHHIAEDHPRQVLPMVMDQYFDVSGNYEQRIAAFSVMMACNPPLVVLQRIVSELSDEINNQVGSYVYSHLSSLANSTVPCQRKVAQKIQLVINQAPDDFEDTGIQNSQSYIADFYDDDKNYGVSTKFEWVASNVSVVPRNMYASISHILGPFEDKLLEIGYNAKGIDELWEKLTQPSGLISQVLAKTGSTVDTQKMEGLLDLVKEKLRLQESDEETPRATIFYQLFGRTSYYNVDETNIINLLTDLFTYVKEFDASSGFSAHYTKVWMPSSLFYVLPSGMGLPAVVNHRNPIVLSVIIENARVSSGDPKESPLNSAFAVSTVIRPSLHVSSMIMAYVVSPAENLLYGAAVHRVFEASTPAVVSLAVDLQKDTYAVSIKPKLPHRAFYHKTSPVTFITQANLINTPKAEWMDDANEIETLAEPLKFDNRMDSKSWGLGLRVQARGESVWADTPFWLRPTASSDGLVPALLEDLMNSEMKAREIHVYLEPHVKEPASQFIFTLDYDREISHHSVPQAEESSEETESNENELFQDYENVLGNIYGKSYQIPDAEKTIQGLIRKTQATWSPVLGQESSEPVPAVISHSWEATAVVKGSGSHSKHLAGKLICSHTLDRRALWVQVFAHKSSDYRGRPTTVCGSFVAAFPPQPNPFYLEMNALRAQQAKFRAELGWGHDCNSDNEIVIHGVLEKTEEQMTTSSNVYLDTPEGPQVLPWYYHQCEVDRQDGMTQSYACQEAISDAATLNRISLDIVTRDLSPELYNLTHKIDLATKAYFYSNMESNPLVSNEENKLSIVIEAIDQFEDLDLCNVYMSKPSENIEYKKLNTPYYSPPSTADSLEELYGDMLFGGEYNAECNLMEDYLNTWDNVTMELPENKCQYLLAQDCTPSPDFVILVSQADLKAKTKALSIAAAGHTIKLSPPVGEHFPCFINDVTHKISRGKPVVIDFEKPSEMIVYVEETVSPAATNVITIKFQDLGLVIVYDGKNAIVQIPRQYQGDTCGLCGDFNGEQFQEYTGPRGCTYLDEEDFVHSYAIPGQSCPTTPKPKGPAFCPPGVKHSPRPQGVHSEDEDSEEEEEDQRRPSPQRNLPQHPRDISSKRNQSSTSGSSRTPSSSLQHPRRIAPRTHEDYPQRRQPGQPQHQPGQPQPHQPRQEQPHQRQPQKPKPATWEDENSIEEVAYDESPRRPKSSFGQFQ